MMIDDAEGVMGCAVLDPRQIRRLAEDAVRARLGALYVAEYGIAGCVRHVRALPDGSVLVELNSGGNAAAVDHALSDRGWLVSRAPRPDYGVRLLVSQGAAAVRRGGGRG